jgi:hypothetical protein
MTGVIAALSVSACVTTARTQANTRPAPYPQRSVAVVAVPVAPRTTVATRPVVVEELVPETNDAYISAAVNADIVFVGGSTYIWAIGPDGHRHRHFYGHGDRRREVFARRDNLRSVTVHRTGHPPANYANRDAARRREDAHRQQLAHGGPPHGPAHPSRDHLSASNPPHHNDPHHQPDPKTSHPVREVSVQRDGSRHRPESGV